MTYYYTAWAGMATVAAIVISQPMAIAALSPQEIAKTAEALTVQINPAADDANRSSGSGFILSKQGNQYTVLTCNHVWIARPATVRTADGQSHPVLKGQSLSSGSGIDLALITFESATDYPVATLGNSDQAEIGAQIFVFGYPVNRLGNRFGEARYFEFSPGYVTSRLPNQTHGYTIRYNAVTQGGMSGGPVFDSDGRVIGIHGLGENDSANVRNLQGEEATPSAELTVQTKTGFNSAIPVNSFLALKQQLGLSDAPVEVNRDASTDRPQQRLQNPDSSLAYNARAQTRESQGDRSGAISDLNQSLTLDSSNADSYYRRGNLRNRQGDRQGAVADYTEAIARSPDHQNAYFNRGVVRNALGDQAGAVEDLTAAINLDPTDVIAYYSRGAIRRSLRDGAGTLEDFEQVVRLAPDRFEAYYNRALAWDMVGDRDKAVADLTQAITLNPQYTPAYIARASERRRLGDRQGGIDDLSTILSYDPDNAVAYYNRGILKRDTGDLQGALGDLERAGVLFQQAGDTANYQKVTDVIQRLNNALPAPVSPPGDTSI
jgi:tetratricopeptide (TPR) repeat protein